MEKRYRNKIIIIIINTGYEWHAELMAWLVIGV